MTDDFGPAIAAFQRKLEEQLQAVTDTKRTINSLMKMSGKEAVYPESDEGHGGAVRADQFYGKPLAPSAAEYLTIRTQACQPDEIFRGLKAGGFDFVLQGWRGDDRDMVRNLSMSLSKNTGEKGKFHRLKNGSFGLRAWYDEAFLKKAGDAPLKTKQKSTNGKKKAKATAKPKAAVKQAKTHEQGKKSQAKPSTQATPTQKPEKMEPVKTKTSAKAKGRPTADQTAPKEAAS
jgi:hypothetical protein